MTLQFRRTLVTVAAFAAAAGSAIVTDAPADRQAASPLVGTWSRTTTCAELVSVLTKYAIPKKMVLEMVAGNSFIPGVSSPDQIADATNPCAGSIPRKHSHFFTKGGGFGSLDWHGQQVDDGRYQVTGPGSVTVFKEFPKVTFRYAIRGKTLSLTPRVPKGCTSFRCAWAVVVSYPGKTWQRVR